jgi:hypothetical protein
MDLQALIDKQHRTHEPGPSFLCMVEPCKSLHEAIEDGKKYTSREVEIDSE